MLASSFRNFDSRETHADLTNKVVRESRDEFCVYYIYTEKYSPKSYVVNFLTQISFSQSEERTMVFTREKK